jgi:maleate cis-trans isomerase
LKEGEAPMTGPVGILYPGYSAEDEYATLELRLGGAARFAVAHTMMVEDAHRLDALLDWGRADRLAEGARALAPHRPSSVVWACTSGSFAFGWDGAREQAGRLADAAGVPASSTSLAFVRAAQALGLREVAVVATYPDDVADLFVAFLRRGGIEVTSLRSHGIVTAAEVGTLTGERLLHVAIDGDAPAAEALLFPDTALHTVAHVETLEQTLGKPVLTANQVSAWEGLRLAGRLTARPRLGALFADAVCGEGDDRAEEEG